MATRHWGELKDEGLAFGGYHVSGGVWRGCLQQGVNVIPQNCTLQGDYLIHCMFYIVTIQKKNKIMRACAHTNTPIATAGDSSPLSVTPSDPKRERSVKKGSSPKLQPPTVPSESDVKRQLLSPPNNGAQFTSTNFLKERSRAVKILQAK